MPSLPGVYAIRSISDSRFYIGCSVHIRRRCQQHHAYYSAWPWVRSNKNLYNWMASCPHAHLYFDVLDTLPAGALRRDVEALELFYIWSYRPHLLVNVHK